MAETEGFEPSIRLTAYDDLANRCLQPLGHVSCKRAFAVICMDVQALRWSSAILFNTLIS